MKCEEAKNVVVDVLVDDDNDDDDVVVVVINAHGNCSDDDNSTMSMPTCCTGVRILQRQLQQRLHRGIERAKFFQLSKQYRTIEYFNVIVCGT